MLELINLIDNITEPYRFDIENQYNQFVDDYFQNDSFHAFRKISLFLTIGVYWIVGTLYTLIDIYKWPNFIYKFKIQINKSQVDEKRLKKLIKQVLINQFIQLLIGSLLLWLQQNNILIPESSKYLPKLSRFIIEWMSFILIREFLFYYLHRLCHHGVFYRHIHKTHHEWQTPIAISATYCHPIEHIFVNVFPVMIGPYLMKSHYLVSNIWFLYAILLTLNDHGGYHFPLTLSPVFHDFHHLKFNVNYGILGLFDWLHGTDKLFRQSKYFKNHGIYFGLNPPDYNFKI